MATLRPVGKQTTADLIGHRAMIAHARGGEERVAGRRGQVVLSALQVELPGGVLGGHVGHQVGCHADLALDALRLDGWMDRSEFKLFSEKWNISKFKYFYFNILNVNILIPDMPNALFSNIFILYPIQLYTVTSASK